MDLSLIPKAFGAGAKLHPEGGKLDRWLDAYEAEIDAWLALHYDPYVRA